MNTVDCHVTAVTGEITCKYNKYWVPVEYVTSWPALGTDGTGNSEIMCMTLEDAEAVKVGLVFQQ